MGNENVLITHSISATERKDIPQITDAPAEQPSELLVQEGRLIAQRRREAAYRFLAAVNGRIWR